VLGPLVLAAAAALPVVIPAPESREHPWVVAPRLEMPAEASPGFLAELPGPGETVTEADLAWLVELAAVGVPVVGTSAAPPAELLPYLDGFLPDPAPDLDGLEYLRQALIGVPLVVRAPDPGAAVAALAAGAAAVVVPDPPQGLADVLAGLLPERDAAGWQDGLLPTAMREADLATVVGLPAGFPGGLVVLPGTWHGESEVISAQGRETLAPGRVGGNTGYVIPESVPAGGVLVVSRPVTALRELVGVAGERP